jgi:uncharacterized membrane protein
VVALLTVVLTVVVELAVAALVAVELADIPLAVAAVGGRAGLAVLAVPSRTRHPPTTRSAITTNRGAVSS